MCAWTGITCSGERVTTINLSGNNLAGIIPTDITTLSDLTSLNIANNTITALPTNIDELTHLTNLQIDSNQITTIPENIINMISLQAGSFVNNCLNIYIPSTGTTFLDEMILAKRTVI